MNIFPQAIKEWETYYLLTGTAAATLIGLLFIAVSINIDVFHRKASKDLQLFAALTFNCFFYVLLISILFLVPGLTALGLGIPLLLGGLISLANTIVMQRRAKTAHSESHTEDLARRFNMPILSLSGLVIVAIGILLNQTTSLYGLIAVVILLLASASQNAWTLLVQASD